MPEQPQADSWPWTGVTTSSDATSLKGAFVNCFAGSDGKLILEHLRSRYADRRVPPTASDSQLRHVEGQRDAIAYVLRMAAPNLSQDPDKTVDSTR